MVQVKQITYKGGDKPICKRPYVHGFTLLKDLRFLTKNKILPQNISTW